MKICPRILLAIVFIFGSVGCGDKPEAPASVEKAPTVSETEIVAQWVALAKNLKPGDAPTALVAAFDKMLEAPPADAQAKKALAQAALALEKAFLNHYLLHGEARSAAKVGEELENRWTRAKALVGDGVGDAEVGALNRALKRAATLQKTITDFPAYRIYASEESASPSLAAAFGARAVGAWARAFVADDDSEKGRKEAGALSYGMAASVSAGFAKGTGWALNQKLVADGGPGCSGDDPIKAGLSGCMLPESLKTLPPSLVGRLSPRGATWGLTLLKLATLAKGEGLEAPFNAIATRAQEALNKVRVAIYPAVMPLAPEGTTGVGAAVTTAVSRGVHFKGTPAMLMVVNKGIEVVRPAHLVMKEGAVQWEEGASTKIPLQALLAADPEKKAAPLAAAKKKLMAGLGEGADVGAPLLLALDLGATAKELSLVTEVVEAAGVKVRGLVDSTGFTGGLALWLTDSETMPEGFPNKRLKVRVTRSETSLELASDKAGDKELMATAPEGVVAKTAGNKKDQRVRVTADAENLENAVHWLTSSYGSYDAVWVDARGAAAGSWQAVTAMAISYAAREKTAHGNLGWMGDVLAKGHEKSSLRPVALQLRMRAPGKKEPAAPAPPPKKLGFCKKADIERTMKSGKGAFKFCYERELGMYPDLAGKVAVRFIIGEDGKVKKAKALVNTIKSRTVAPCVVKRIKKMRFPEPEGGQCEVNWPFKFQPGG